MMLVVDKFAPKRVRNTFQDVNLYSRLPMATGKSPASRVSVGRRTSTLGLRKRATRCPRVARPGPALRSATPQQSGGAVSVTEEPAAAPVDKFEITLQGLEAFQTVRLGLVPRGKGQAIVVTEVAEGSRAEQLGVRRGQRLNALSDPMRYGTMWNLEDRPSLRFVVDTFKMRRSSPIDLEFEPMMSPEDMNAFFGDASVPAEGAAEAAQAQRSADPAPAATAGSRSGAATAVDMSPDDALGTLNSIDSMLGSTSDEESGTIGERLAAKYAAQERARMAVNQVQQRIDRRKAYMEIDDQRDDTGLLLGLAAAFLLPALIILVVAYFTGYLDRLYLTALTLR